MSICTLFFSKKVLSDIPQKVEMAKQVRYARIHFFDRISDPTSHVANDREGNAEVLLYLGQHGNNPIGALRRYFDVVKHNSAYFVQSAYQIRTGSFARSVEV